MKFKGENITDLSWRRLRGAHQDFGKKEQSVSVCRETGGGGAERVRRQPAVKEDADKRTLELAA